MEPTKPQNDFCAKEPNPVSAAHMSESIPPCDCFGAWLWNFFQKMHAIRPLTWRAGTALSGLIFAFPDLVAGKGELGRIDPVFPSPSSSISA
jgi:hypothetical protein